MSKDYSPPLEEPVIQAFWQESGFFKSASSIGHNNCLRYYILSPLQKPSIVGPHLKEQYPHIVADVIARFYRSKGNDVLFPVGYNPFSIKFENHSNITKQSVEAISQDYLQYYSTIIQSMGYSHDFSKEMDTSSDEYIQWTQWLFAMMWDSYYDTKKMQACPISELKVPAEVSALGQENINSYVNSKRLLYYEKCNIHYSPETKAFYADDEISSTIKNGPRTLSGNHYVYKVNAYVWKLRTSVFARRLYADLSFLDWPDSVIEEHKRWIGPTTEELENAYFSLGDVICCSANYWGIPLPLLCKLNDKGFETSETILDDNLPVKLPVVPAPRAYSSDGVPCLESAKEWLKINKDGVNYKRESSVLSEWCTELMSYLYLTLTTNTPLDLHQSQSSWIPIDFYVAGQDTKYIMYWRFIHKVLYDRGVLCSPEPINKLVSCGKVFFPEPYTGYKKNDKWVTCEAADDFCSEVGLHTNEITTAGDTGKFQLASHSKINILDRAALSQKNGGCNIIRISKLIETYGSDAVRYYLLTSPSNFHDFESSVGVDHVAEPSGWALALNKIKKIYDIVMEAYTKCVDTDPSVTEKVRIEFLSKNIHSCMEDCQFSLCYEAIMKFVSYLNTQATACLGVLKKFVIILQPFLPHLSEKLWQLINDDSKRVPSVIQASFPPVNFKEVENSNDLIFNINDQVNTSLILRKDTPVHQIVQQVIESLGKEFDTDRISRLTIIPNHALNLQITPEKKEETDPQVIEQ